MATVAIYKESVFLKQFASEALDFEKKCADLTGFVAKQEQEVAVKDSFSNQDRDILFSPILYVPIPAGTQSITISVQVEPKCTAVQFFKQIQGTVIYVQKLLDAILAKNAGVEEKYEAIGELKEKLEALLLLLENVLLSIASNKESEDDQELIKLQELKSQILYVLSQINEKNLKPWVGDNDAVTFAYLGLNKNIKSEVTNLDSPIREHRSLLTWIFKFMDNQYDIILSQLDEGKDLSFEEQLKCIGFTNSRAIVLAKWISSDSIFTHRNLLYWAKQYVEIEDALFTESLHCSFPFEQNKIGQWFKHCAALGFEADQSDNLIEIQCKNVWLDKLKNDFMEELLGKSVILKDCTLWFHGTSSQSAVDIFKNGIDLERGEPKCDFGKGFYVTTNFHHAVSFAIAKYSKNCMCVIAFVIKNSFKEEYRGFDLKGENWQNTIDHYSWRNRNLSKCKQIKQAYWLAGKTSSHDSRCVTATDIDQLCIKRDPVADHFSRSISCAVFFMKN